ncbi:cathepsin L-like [Carcharodon carcharias]|uniref:cathepsin L-like n=1 Tax=Carcharodon carcharias TaxID=13397 RepID=UPI001B7D9794|nr:cathepsin L-like [Carcharodon carcharias]XP_041037746.1 cathepsin L-like [Carcharodon carcharias]
MFRVAVICLALSFGLLHAEVDVEEDDIDIEDEAELRSKFEEFKEQYKKTYDQKEEEKRFQIFVENLKAAKRMQEQDRGTAIYGITKFSDMSDEEFGGFYLNPVISNNNDTWPEEMLSAEVAEPLTNMSLPRCFDWRKLGAVTEVKNQRRCGSCWAFGTVANIESLLYIKTHKLITLSEQELLDCDHWDKGCKGGYPFNAFNSICHLGGMMSSRDYRYKGRQHSSCHFKSTRVVMKIRTYHFIQSHEVEMQRWIAHRGPIVVTMNASALKIYKRGILRPRIGYCSCNKLDHVALITGYGVARGKPYWVVKNSWGKKWGEQGYFRIYRGENACGISRFPVTATI